jgi:hypothetical protein
MDELPVVATRAVQMPAIPFNHLITSRTFIGSLCPMYLI